MFKLIVKICNILNLYKDFEAGYSSKTVDDGYFLIKYDGKAYAVKIAEMPEYVQKLDAFKQIDQLKYCI